MSGHPTEIKRRRVFPPPVTVKDWAREPRALGGRRKAKGDAATCKVVAAVVPTLIPAIAIALAADHGSSHGPSTPSLIPRPSAGRTSRSAPFWPGQRDRQQGFA